MDVEGSKIGAEGSNTETPKKVRRLQITANGWTLQAPPTVLLSPTHWRKAKEVRGLLVLEDPSPHSFSPLLSSPLLTPSHLSFLLLSSPLLTSPFFSSPHSFSPLLSSPLLTPSHLSFLLLSPLLLTSPFFSSPHPSSPLLSSPLPTPPHPLLCRYWCSWASKQTACVA